MNLPKYTIVSLLPIKRCLAVNHDGRQCTNHVAGGRNWCKEVHEAQGVLLYVQYKKVEAEIDHLLSNRYPHIFLVEWTRVIRNHGVPDYIWNQVDNDTLLRFRHLLQKSLN